jgi:hypothetical protein
MVGKANKCRPTKAYSTPSVYYYIDIITLVCIQQIKSKSRTLRKIRKKELELWEKDMGLTGVMLRTS